MNRKETSGETWWWEKKVLKRLGNRLKLLLCFIFTTQYFVINEKRAQNVVVNDVLIISNKFLRVNKKMY